jgi:hypothetical protein
METDPMKILSLPLLSLLGLLTLPLHAAASEEEVLAFLKDYSALEGDLDAQSRYIRDDRVWIAVSRWAHGPDFMAWQEAQRDHRAKQTDGQGDTYHVQMESPIIRVYGDTAVASYLRRTQVMPSEGPIVTQPPLWISLVLVKEAGSWGIAHSHISPARPWN